MEQFEKINEESFEAEYEAEELITEPDAEEIVEELDEDFEKSDSFTGMSPADKQKHRLEYMQLIKEIEGQNNIVDQLKDQIMTNCQRPCLTKCELREIKNLRECAENENLKLQCMVRKAIQIQNENPNRFFGEIPIVTTLEEDVLPRMGACDILKSLEFGQGLVGERKQDACRAYCKTYKKNKRCCHTEDDINTETCKLFEEMALKDELVECLQNTIQGLQQKLHFRCRKTNPSADGCQKQFGRVGQTLENKITRMQSTVDMLKADLKCFCKEKQSSRPVPTHVHRKSNDLRMLKEDYAKLLVKCTRKDYKLKQLENRLKGNCVEGGSAADSKNASSDEVELKILQEQVSDLRDEKYEYSCIIKEQSEQLEDYRQKYIDAQQKVEEQKCMLEKIEMTNKRIDGQIEAEVKLIKAKFKEQLSELSQYPKLLENEQIKLATACKDRDQLMAKLGIVCKELKSVRERVTVQNNKPDCSQKLTKCEQDLLFLQDKTDQLQKEKDIVCEELHKAKLELDTMRSESAKIITSTKERFEVTKSTMCSRIDILEKELAQCRANAYISVTDREAVIKEMQSQLSTISYSFDSAQKQIKTLKNHITFLSNE